MRGKTKGLITAGMSPSFTSVKPKVASEAAMVMSATQQSAIPPPSAAPCTAAITGTGHSSTATSISCRRAASASFSSIDRPIEARCHSMSAPAQKTSPSPAAPTPAVHLVGQRPPVRVSYASVVSEPSYRHSLGTGAEL